MTERLEPIDPYIVRMIMETVGRVTRKQVISEMKQWVDERIVARRDLSRASHHLPFYEIKWKLEEMSR